MTTLTVVATILSILGNILSTLLALSPIKQFIEIDKKRDVGKMNIIPIIFLSANSMMWIIYGMITKRLSILPVNTFGLLITVYFIFVFYGATNDLYSRRKIALIFFALFTTLVVFSQLVIMMASDDHQPTILGFTCNIVLFCFFFSPVFGLFQVIKKRDVSTMNYPLALTSTVAATCWTFYGILVKDPFIIVPNGAGAVISFTQLVVYFIIKKLTSGYSDHLNDGTPSSPTFISESQPLEMEEETPGEEI